MAWPLTALALVFSAPAPMPVVLTVTVHEHRFEPSYLIAPAHTAVQLLVKNDDETFEEIESYPLNLERRVGPGKTVSVRLGPLDPGHYEIVGEDHPDTAQAMIEVR